MAQTTPGVFVSRPTASPIVPTLDEAEEFACGFVAPSTRRAYQADLVCFWTWARTAGCSPGYPVPVEVVLRFIDQQLSFATAGESPGIAPGAAKNRAKGCAVATVARRVLVLGLVHRARGFRSPCEDDRVKVALRQARRRAAGQAVRRKPVTREVLDQLLATCNESLRGRRDRALLLLGFGSGGRRRSELAALQYENLTRVSGGYLLRIRRSKTDPFGSGLEVPVLGRVASALERWLLSSGIRQGALFRGVDPGGGLTAALCDKAIANIIKRCIHRAGLDPHAYSAHSLRSGFITEAGRQRIPLGAAMALSGHRSITVALRYYHAGDALTNPAGRLLG